MPRLGGSGLHLGEYEGGSIGQERVMRAGGIGQILRLRQILRARGKRKFDTSWIFERYSRSLWRLCSGEIPPAKADQTEITGGCVFLTLLNTRSGYISCPSFEKPRASSGQSSPRAVESYATSAFTTEPLRLPKLIPSSCPGSQVT